MNSIKEKTENILKSSIDAALLAVEVYNKPRTTFRSQAYIVLMIIAWTRLFHAYFNKTIGDKYYYKKNGDYQMIDGQERKAWELKKCIKKYEKYESLRKPVKANLQFFIGLRNKIEHRNIDKKEVDTSIFGECQSLLYNYENLLIHIFGKEHALNESLAFALQFSYMRHKKQEQASKSVLSAELQEIRRYIEEYRSNLSEDDFNSQEYSIKLIQVPKISNTNRHDLAITFVKEAELDPEVFEQIATIIKDQRVLVEAKNVGKILPGKVVEKVKSTTLPNFNQYDHRCLYTIFSVRPPGKDSNPGCTNSNFCHYDQVHKDYLYQESWVEFIVKLFEVHRLTKEKIRHAYKNGEKLEIDQYC